MFSHVSYKYGFFLILFIVFICGGIVTLRHGSMAARSLNFELIDQNGKAVSQDDYMGDPLLIFFGFTGCSNICPLTIVRISEIIRSLENEKLNIRGMFISVDPVHDTPAVIKEYLENFDSDITGLTGSEDDLNKLYEDFKVYPGSLTASDPLNIDHSGFIYLVNGSGATIAHFTMLTDAATMQQEIKAALTLPSGQGD